MNGREIKFRAWHLVHKVMFEHKNIPVLLKNTKDDTVWQYMQYTGKKDCKGKEIYEGDIIEFDRKEWGGDGNIHAVSWNERDAEWSWGGGCTGDMDWRTVIGNIYENPELLNP